MGYLSSDGTVNHSDIAADLGMLDPRVVEKFAAGKATAADPTGKQGADRTNSTIISVSYSLRTLLWVGV